MDWRIIVGKAIDGNLEYEVSDGNVGERSCSFDFKTFDEAKEFMDKLNIEGEGNA